MEKKIEVKGMYTPKFLGDHEVEINDEVITYKEYSYRGKTDTWEFIL